MIILKDRRQARNSHSMLQKNGALKPRKKPVQDRSTVTCDAIFEATIQVLLAMGPEQLTTTKVADRAGVSVGTLYQYFGNKQSLLSAVTEKHLLEVAESIERACCQQVGLNVEEIIDGLFDAYFDAKFSRPDVSKALYAVAADVDGNQMVKTLMQRVQVNICQLLQSAKGLEIEDTITTAFVLTTTMVGPVQTLLTIDAPDAYRDKVKSELKRMALLYLTNGKRQILY